MATTSYEFPFNERIRTFLRVENLFSKLLTNADSGLVIHHHYALLTLLQILDVVDRSELKLDLLQELDRQKNHLQMLKGNPAISDQKLTSLLQDIQFATEGLRADSSKLGYRLRNNEWLMSIKQRSGIPGGVCEFDVPSYHFWLNLGGDKRKADLKAWITPLQPMYRAIKVILQILRGSGEETVLTATSGVYQEMLGSVKPAQMLKVTMAKTLACFPEVSANKYAINIRFNQLDAHLKPQKCEDTIEFSLMLCNL